MTRTKQEIEIESESGAEGEIMAIDSEMEVRGKWKRNIDFLFACLGFSVGFGNVWRFPYLCFKNGGGAFLIPYFISVLVTGIPMFFLEVSVGQLMSRGGIEAWEIIPLFKGVGYAGTFILFCLNSYYNVILAWISFYLFASMQRTLPWSSCGNAWNTANCVDSNSNTSVIPAFNTTLSTDPVNEYWERRVLGISSGIDEVGTVRWELALCLLFAWIVVFLCIFRGIRASGKVLYITATAPFILMAILLGRTAALNGAKKGMIYYMQPKWERLASLEVWSDAGTQIFFSYSISLGTLTALGGFNDFHHNTVSGNNVEDGGVYIFQLFDYYLGSRIILLVAMFECIVVGFVFGARRYEKCLKKMFRINFYYLPSIVYCGIVPWFSLTLFVFSVVVYGRLTYKHSSGVYEFPHYSVVMGWLLASCSVACIPAVALCRLIKAEGTLWQRLKDLCQPNLTAAALMNLEACDELAPKTGNSVDQELCGTTEIEVSNTKIPDSCPLKMTDSGTKSSC
nr:sodium:chloride dependent neurotransmitter [Hymenolepis microstoma]